MADPFLGIMPILVKKINKKIYKIWRENNGIMSGLRINLYVKTISVIKN